MTPAPMRKILVTVALLAGFLAACDGTQPPAEPKTTEAAPQTRDAAAEERPPAIAQVPFAPGGGAPVHEESALGRRIMDDPEQIAAGKQLYAALNCVGCHFHGGGGMGPPLMDQTWIYGSSIENIAASIREGRPKGMPAFRGHVPEEQIWQLAAYVRSMSRTAEDPDASQ